MKAEGSPSQSSKEGRLIVGNLVGEGQSTRYQGLIEVAQAEQWTGWRGNQWFSLGISNLKGLTVSERTAAL